MKSALHSCHRSGTSCRCSQLLLLSACYMSINAHSRTTSGLVHIDCGVRQTEFKPKVRRDASHCLVLTDLLKKLRDTSIICWLFVLWSVVYVSVTPCPTDDVSYNANTGTEFSIGRKIILYIGREVHCKPCEYYISLFHVILVYCLSSGQI